MKEACAHVNAELRRIRGADGGLKCLTLWCDGCRNHVSRERGFSGIWIGKNDPKVAHVDPESVPWLARETAWRQCQGPCKQLAECEFHHFAPRAFFGESADDWPTAWLCKVCHGRWHTAVTPGLCTSYDPSQHAQLLLDYLRLERAHPLIEHLITMFKERRRLHRGAA